MSGAADRLDALRERLEERHPPTLIALALAILVVLGIAARVFVLPGIVRAKVAERAARLGLDVSVDGVSVGFGAVELSGVTVRRAADGAALGNVVSVEVAGGFFGTSASELTLTEPHVSLKVSDLSSVLASLRGGSGAPEAPAETGAVPGGKRVLHVKGLALALSDDQGPLVAVEGARLERSAENKIDYAVDRLKLGAEPHEALEFSGVTGALAGTASGLAVQRLAVEHGQLRWASATAENVEGRLVPRLKALRSQLRGSTTADASTTPAAAEPTSERRLWTEDADLSLADVTVTEIGSEERPVASQLSLHVQALPQGMFKVSGKGVAPGDGRVAIDLRVNPQSLRVEGDVTLHKVALLLLAPVLPPFPFEGLERTRLDAKLTLSGQGLEAISAKGELSLTDLGFASPRLSALPVGPISFSARGEATYKPATRELADMKASLDVGSVHISTTGSIALPADGYDVELSLAMPKSSCDAVLQAVPSGILDELQGVRLTGDISAKIDASVHADRLDETKLEFDIKDHCKFATVTPILDVRRFERPFVHRVVEPDDTVYEFETGPGTGAWAPIELISPFMTQAAIAHEDGRFLGHRGFAPKEIGAALARNLKAKAFRFGASTITMQLVKNVFLHREKLLARKLQEAFIVWWLEQHWDKKHILELYLNVIEYGPALYGIRQASLHYFGVSPYELTPAQSAFLASILPNPKGYYEYYEKGRLSDSMKNRMVKFLEHMRSKNRIDDEALKFGIEETHAFVFYDPKKPPPPPKPLRGQAEPLPFMKAGSAFPSWDDPGGFQEDGSFR